jgi:hypothetical protein
VTNEFAILFVDLLFNGACAFVEIGADREPPPTPQSLQLIDCRLARCFNLSRRRSHGDGKAITVQETRVVNRT